MKSCQFDDRELELLNHAVKLFQRDLRFDFETFYRKNDLQSMQHCIDRLSTIEFILPKIKI